MKSTLYSLLIILLVMVAMLTMFLPVLSCSFFETEVSYDITDALSAENGTVSLGSVELDGLQIRILGIGAIVSLLCSLVGAVGAVCWKKQWWTLIPAALGLLGTLLPAGTVVMIWLKSTVIKWTPGAYPFVAPVCAIVCMTVTLVCVVRTYRRQSRQRVDEQAVAHLMHRGGDL